MVRACDCYVQDMSEIAVELGFPACSVDRFVADPESGITLPNPALVPNFTRAEPPEGHEWIYPFTTQPHYQSQNAGPWYCSPAGMMGCSSNLSRLTRERQLFIG